MFNCFSLNYHIDFSLYMYTKDFLTRYKQLKIEHGIDELYLIYAQPIKNEAIERELHKRLKTYKNIQYYPVAKQNKQNKKNDNKSICTETYIFNYLTYNTIIQ